MTQSDPTIRIVARDQDRKHISVFFEFGGRWYEKGINPASFAKPGDNTPDQIRKRIVERTKQHQEQLGTSAEQVSTALEQELTTQLNDGTTAHIELQKFTEKSLVWKYSWNGTTDVMRVRIDHWSIFLSYLCDNGLTTKAVSWIKAATKREIEERDRCQALPTETLDAFVAGLPVEIDPFLKMYEGYRTVPPTLWESATPP